MFLYQRVFLLTCSNSVMQFLKWIWHCFASIHLSYFCNTEAVWRLQKKRPPCWACRVKLIKDAIVFNKYINSKPGGKTCWSHGKARFTLTKYADLCTSSKLFPKYFHIFWCPETIMLICKICVLPLRHTMGRECFWNAFFLIKTWYKELHLTSGIPWCEIIFHISPGYSEESLNVKRHWPRDCTCSIYSIAKYPSKMHKAYADFFFCVSNLYIFSRKKRWQKVHRFYIRGRLGEGKSHFLFSHHHL